MEPIIHNLDKHHEPEKIIIGGQELDISFIPAGISIPLMVKYQEYIDKLKEYKVINDNGDINQKNELKDPKKAYESYEMMIDVVAMFTEYMDEKLDKKWLGRHTDLDTIGEAFSILTKSIVKDIQNRREKQDKKKLNGNE